MSAFDDLTLGEVEEIVKVALEGKGFNDPTSDPLMLAGGVMWITRRRDDPSLTWVNFKNNTRMAEIKSFSIAMEAEAMDPTNVPDAIRN